MSSGLTHGNYKEMNILYAKYKTQGVSLYLAVPFSGY